MKQCLLPAVICLLSAPLWTFQESAMQEKNVEVGLVNWGRDLDKACGLSRSTGKPVLVLFQEVPGCAGCQKFGKTVLSHPLIVEGMEDEFIPVLVYNNRKGRDAEILKKFKEPAWNYQVIRFLDGSGKDIIPRRDKVWDIAGVAGRMAQALVKANRQVPAYLVGLKVNRDGKNLSQIVFAMACFWTGEMKLGLIDGVMLTEAGFFDGREVTRVWHDPDVVDVTSLVKRAFRERCAQSVYCPGAETLAQVKSIKNLVLPMKPFDVRGYRKAPAGDQKKQIRGTPFVKIGATEHQLTKINAFIHSDKARALRYLSPRQLALLGKGPKKSAARMAAAPPPKAAMATPEQAAAMLAWFSRPADQRGALPESLRKHKPMNRQACEALRNDVWQAYKNAMIKAGKDKVLPTPTILEKGRQNALSPAVLDLGEKKMPFFFIGKGDMQGKRPLFIALHGGGSAGGRAKSPHGWSVNTREWQTQLRLAAGLYPDDALYFVPRMADDNDGRWYYRYCQDAYDRAVRHGILFHNVDPNRVYLIGISEGAYTAYRMGAFMADRWAGAGSMAGGEPLRNAPPENMRNIAFRADIGERDTMFDRVGLNVRYGEALEKLQKDDADGFKHVINVQKGRGHGIDYGPCPKWLFENKRNPWPVRVTWMNINVHGRRRMQSYWLAIDEKPEGKLFFDARLDKAHNSVDVKVSRKLKDGKTEADNSVAFRVYLNDHMLDLEKPVRITRNGQAVFKGKVTRKAAVLMRSVAERGDPCHMFPSEVHIKGN